ncbi:T9SS type A sorting domain-containing protein [Aquirufa sp. KTFRIE-69F]|uniref:T9SS type A sorting domain-containing protein n=1 Tax=Aquirufa originis TaxID=3096514 RepID=A0ABW6D4F5_9BACT
MKTLFFLFYSFAAFAQCATINTQPLPQITCEGDSIRLIVVSSNGTFQWEKRRPSDAKFTSITNARAARYHFLSGGATHPTGSYYRLKVTLGKCIIYSDSVLVTLRKAPVISNFTICEKTLISFPYSWTLNGQAVDSIIATPTLNGAKIKAFARYSTLPLGSCILASNEVSLSVTSLPAAPSHSVKLVKACVGLPFSLNATGCSPSLTYWYNSDGLKIGEGSRLPLIASDSAIFRATCVKSGCEGPLSSGVKTAIYPIPAPPQNTSSNYFCSDVAFSLQASGGLNNIWYESESAKSSLSTATALAIKAISNTGINDSLLVRFASVKINDCESTRIPVTIRIKPRLVIRALNPISLTGERTISVPETLPLNGTPPYRITYSSSAKSPLGPFTSNGFLFRTATDSLGCSVKDTTEVNYVRNGPIIHRLTALFETNCLTNNYRIRINGCPMKTSALSVSKRYESAMADFILTGGNYTFLCNDGETDTLTLNLPVLKQPSSLQRKSFTSPICDADSASLSLTIDSSVHFIGWELNGHLFATDKIVRGLLPSGEYQSVFEENGCFYRSEKINLDRKANPPAPRLEKMGAYFVKTWSLGIPEWLIDQTKSYDTSAIRKITEGREFYVRAKWMYKSLSCFSPYSNVYYVDNPATYEFAVYPNPNQGKLSIEIAYEISDAEVHLFDLKGKLLDSMKIKNSSRRIDWDISRFPAGTYVLRLISDGVSQEKTIRKSL